MTKRKRAKKKELDPAGRGFGGKLEHSGEGGGGIWKLHSFKFSS